MFKSIYLTAFFATWSVFLITFLIASYVFVPAKTFVHDNSTAPLDLSKANEEAAVIDAVHVSVEAGKRVSIDVVPCVAMECVLGPHDIPADISLANNLLTIAAPHNILATEGSLEIQVNGTNKVVVVNVAVKESVQLIDNGDFQSLVEKHFSQNKDSVGIYLYDFERNYALQYQSDLVLAPASISKLPSVLLVLRDIEAGKLSFNTTIPVENRYKHSQEDAIGRLPAGTLVTIEQLIQEAIVTSNNTAHYHLHGAVLGGMVKVNARSQDELAAGQFYLDPHIATAEDIGRVLRLLEDGVYLNTEHTQYVLDLLINTSPSLRTALPAGIPDDVEVANKVGFLFGGIEGEVYNDAAIVYAPFGTFVLVILQENAASYPAGRLPLQAFTAELYAYFEEENDR